MMLRGEGKLSPTHFHNSIHNTASGYASIATGNGAPSTTLSGGAELVASSFLDIFGRPARTSACECERVDAPSLAQALTLINSAEIQCKLTAENGYAAKLASNQRASTENTKDVFLRLLGRAPRVDELQAAVDFLGNEEDRQEAYRSLLWSLLATNEFMFNH